MKFRPKKLKNRMIKYKHHKKQGEYIILDLIYLQNPQGERKEAVLYKSLSSDKKFARFESEFNIKFELCNIQ